MIDVSLLKVLFDDDLMIRKYLVVFRDDLPESLLGLREYVQNMDWDNASTTAHNLRSKLQYLKEDGISTMAYEIEKICDEPGHLNIEKLKILLDKIENELLEVYRKVDNYLSVY